jgi:hypothetical protein
MDGTRTHTRLDYMDTTLVFFYLPSFFSLSLLLGLYMLGRCGSVERPARTDNRMDHTLCFQICLDAAVALDALRAC